MSFSILRIACMGEVATGLGLLVYPSIVIRPLLGLEISGAGIFASRIAGIALIALGVACWPGGATRGLVGMTVYSVVATVYLAVAGVLDGQTGILWWPACVAHGVMSVLLARELMRA